MDPIITQADVHWPHNSWTRRQHKVSNWQGAGPTAGLCTRRGRQGQRREQQMGGQQQCAAHCRSYGKLLNYYSGQGGACRAALLWWGSIALQKQSSTPVHDAFLMDYNAPVHWEMLAVPMFCWMCLRSDAPIPLLFLQLSTKRLPRLRMGGRQRPAGPDGGGGPRRGRRGSPRTAAAVQRVLAWVCTMRAHAISHMTARTHGEHNISHMSCGAHNISTCDVARIKTAHDIWRASYQKNWEYAPQPAWP